MFNTKRGTTEKFGQIKSTVDEDGNIYALVEVLDTNGNCNQINLMKIAYGDETYAFGDIFWQKYQNSAADNYFKIADIDFDVFNEIHIAFNNVDSVTGLVQNYIQKYNIFGTQIESSKLEIRSQEDANYDSAMILGCASDVSGDSYISGCVLRSKEIGTNYGIPFDLDTVDRLSQESLVIFKFRKDHDFRAEPDQTSVVRKYPRTAEATLEIHPDWAASTVYAANSFVKYLGNIYTSVAGGTSGSNPPTHLTGGASDGGVTWTFISKVGQLVFNRKLYLVDDLGNQISGYVTSWDTVNLELILNNVSGLLEGNPVYMYQIDPDNTTTPDASFAIVSLINLQTQNNYNAEYEITLNAGHDFTTLASTTRSISNITSGSAGIQQFDIGDSATSGLTIASDYITNPRITKYAARIATIPNPAGQTLKVTPNIKEKYYIEKSNVVRTQRAIELTLNVVPNFTIGTVLTQNNTSATARVAAVNGNRVTIYDIGTSTWLIGSGNTITSATIGDTIGTYVTSFAQTKYVFVRTNLTNYMQVGDIINVQGFTQTVWNGNFNVSYTPTPRDFLFYVDASTANTGLSVVPSATSGFDFGGNINNVFVFSKSPILNLIRGQRYKFDTSHPSNLGYYLNFSKDNLNKIEFDFRNIPSRVTNSVSTVGTFVTIELTEDIEQIIYYYAQNFEGEDALSDPKSFINVIDNPYQGTFNITRVPTNSTFTIELQSEPDKETASNITSTTYSTTSRNVTGPIATVKLINSGGFYRKLPSITGVVTERNITKIIINQPGQNYVDGTYENLVIDGNGVGGRATIRIVGGELVEALVTDPGIGYTTASLTINTIPGIISQGGAGAEVTVYIPPTGNGATIFPVGTEIGKIKTIKNSNFGFDYPHDYTLRPEITFPINLQLRDASSLREIKITNPGSGYTTVPEVIIEGGGGTGATATATVRNNRLDNIIVTNPGSGYSSPPDIKIASVFAYRVNVDDQLLQFSFPHGINTGDIIRLQGEELDGVAHVLPSPSSAGLVSLDGITNYYAVAGSSNNLDVDQLRIALTIEDAQTGAFITFANEGQGKQQLTTEAFAGAAEAIVDVVTYLPGELVYQGDNPDTASAAGYVSEIDGWQQGPRILRLTTPSGTFVENEKVTGLISKSTGTIDSINQSKGILNIASTTKTAGEFADNFGQLNDSSQRIQDSYFYQNFSYVIKSEVEINEWRDTIKSSVHPGGFRVFGELTLREPDDIIVGSRFTTSVERKVEITDIVSVATISNFTNVEPIYEALANSSVLFRDKDLTSSEVILTSVAKKIVDISEEFDGTKKTFSLKTGDPVNAGQTVNITPPADSLIVVVNGIAQAPAISPATTAPPNSFEISGSNITFAEPPSPPTKIQYREITFDTQTKAIIYPEATLEWTANVSYNVGDYVYSGSYSYRVVTAGTSTIAPSHISENVVQPSPTDPAYQYIGTHGTTLEIGDELIGTESGAIGIISEITSPYGAEDQLTISQVDGKFRTGEKLRIVDKYTVVAARFADGSNLLEANKEFIAAEAVARSHVQFDYIVPGGDQNCIDDVIDVTEAVAFNLKYGGNSKVYDAAEIYVGAGASLNFIETEKEQAEYVYEQARLIALDVITNTPVQVIGDHGKTQTTDNTITVDPSATPCANVQSAVSTLYSIVKQTIADANPRQFFDALARTIPTSPAVEFGIIKEFDARIEVESIFFDGAVPPTQGWLVGDTLRGSQSGQEAVVVGIITQTAGGTGNIIAQTLEVVYTNTTLQGGFINREFDSTGAVSIQPEQVYNPALAIPGQVGPGQTALYGSVVVQQKTLVQFGIEAGPLDTQGDFIVGEEARTTTNDECIINTDKQYDLEMEFEYDRRNPNGIKAPIYISKGATVVQNIYEKSFDYNNLIFNSTYSPTGLSAAKGIITDDYSPSKVASIVNIKDLFAFNLRTRTGQMYISVDPNSTWGTRYQISTGQLSGPFTAYSLNEGDIIASSDDSYQFIIDEMQVINTEFGPDALIRYKLLRGPKTVDTAGSGNDLYDANFDGLPNDWKLIREGSTDKPLWQQGQITYRGQVRRYGNLYYEAVFFSSATVPTSGLPYGVTGSNFVVSTNPQTGEIVSAFDGNVNWIIWNPTDITFVRNSHAQDEYRIDVIEKDLIRLRITTPIFTEPDIPVALAFQEQYTLIINYGGQQTTGRVVYWDPGRLELVVKDIGNLDLLGVNAVLTQNIPYGNNQTAIIQSNLQSADVKTDLNNTAITPFFATNPRSKTDPYVIIEKRVSGAGSGDEGLLKVGIDDIGTNLIGQSGGTTGKIKNVAVAVDKLTDQNLDDIFLSEVLISQTDPITGTVSFLPNIPSFFGVVFERISVPGQANTILDDLSKSVLRYSLNGNTPFRQFFDITNDTLVYKNEDILSVFHFEGIDQQSFTFDTSHNPVRNVLLNGTAQLLTATSKFGNTSLYLNGVSDYMSVATNTSYGFGANDFAVEGWFYIQNSGVRYLFDFRNGANSDNAPYVYADGSTIYMGAGASTYITGTSAISSSVWYHIALTRSSNVTKLFVNGQQVGSNYNDTNNYGSTKPLNIGADYADVNLMQGFVDEFIVWSYGRYVDDFAVPTESITDLVSETDDLQLDTLNMLNINNISEFDQSEVYTMDRLTYPSTYNPPVGITAGVVLKNATGGTATSGTIMRVDRQNRRIYLKNVSGGSGFAAGNLIYDSSNNSLFVLESYVQRAFNASQIANKRLLTFRAGGTGASATFNFDNVTGELSVNSITGGQFYASAPQVTIEAPPPGGTQALATATVTNGVVTAINLLDPGSGYTSSPSVSILGGPGVGTFKVGDEVTGVGSGVVADVISWDADARELIVVVVGPDDFAADEFIQGPSATPPDVTAYYSLDDSELLETTLIAKTIPSFDSGDIIYGSTTTTDGEVQSYQNNTANIISSRVRVYYGTVTPTGNIFTVGSVVQVIENGQVIAEGTVTSFNVADGSFLLNNITGYFKVGDIIESQVIPLGGGGAVTVSADVTKVENFVDLNQVNGSGIAEKYEIYDNATNWSSTIKTLKRKQATISDVSTETKMILDTDTIIGDEFVIGDTITSVYTEDDVTTFNGSTAGINGVGGVGITFDHLYVPNHGLQLGDKVTYTTSFSGEVLILNNTTTGQFFAGQNIFSDFGGVAFVTEVTGGGRVLFIRDRQGPFTPGLTVTQGATSETVNQFIDSPAIGGLVEEQEYYVIPGTLNPQLASVSGDYLSLATTLQNAQTGQRVNITRVGYGTVHYLTKRNTIVADGVITNFVKGFDGEKTIFPITAGDGNTYAPPAEGHLLVFLNGVLQDPGTAFTVFGTNITFTEAPTSGSQFFAYYIGRLRKLDDLSSDFDSLKSSFNLLLNGNPYSLSLSEGVQNQVVKAENNLIISINGILQEPGVAFSLLGSRIDFAEAPRSESQFLAFSFVGSDADVIASEIIPPIEVGDELRIQGEITNRGVAVVGSSNELTTFDYQGTIQGVGANLVPILTSGYISSIRVTNGGTGYTSNPNVAILSNTGTGAQAISLVGINEVQVQNNGSGYVNPTIIEVGGTAPTRSAILEPKFNKRGGISGIVVRDPGEGYDETDLPQLIVQGAGSPIRRPNLQPIIDSGRLVSVRIFESGAGFDNVRVDIIADYNPNTVTGSGGVVGSTGFDPTTIFNVSGSSAEAYLTSSIMYVYSDGLPAPALPGTFPNQNNPNTITRQNITHEFIWRGGTGSRGQARNRQTPLGIIGLLANGVALFNPSAGDGGNPPVGFNYNAGNHDLDLFGEDACGGHPEEGGLYHYHSAEFLSNCWNPVLSANPYYDNTNFNGDKSRHANGHSKIIGVSFDGYPIYGPYGYAEANNANSTIRRIESSYRLKESGYDVNRPLPSLEPMGSFIQDFEYVQNLGDLDASNGRFCITPEYPNGTYAYFMTLDEQDHPAYPYAIGPNYYAEAVPYGEEVPTTVDQIDPQAPFGAYAEPVVDNQGEIVGINMRSFGENYYINSSINVRIRGFNGSGATGVATSGIVVGVRLTTDSATGRINEGVGYRSTSTEPTVVTLTGGGGTGATAAAEIETFGKITSVQIVDGGRFFVQPPNLRVISGTGIGARLRPVISAGSIVDVIIEEPGKGYQSVPDIAFTRPVDLIRKNRNRSSFNSSANRLTSLAQDVARDATTINATSTNGFLPAGEIYVNKEKISYSGLTETTFTGLQRGINFRYDQRVVVDSSQQYNFEINDIINRSGSTAASKVSRVYDWRPSTRELLIIFEVDELAEIDAGRPLEPTSTVRFNGGLQTGCQQFDNAGGCILSFPAQSPGSDHINDPDTGIVDNAGTQYEFQIALDGGAPDTLYGLEAQTQGINTTLLTVNEIITDSDGRQSVVIEAGGLGEGVPHTAQVELVLSSAASAATFTVGNSIDNGVAFGEVVSWDQTTRTLTIGNISSGVFEKGSTITGTTYTIDSVNYTTLIITTTSI
ncbi:structural protein [Synechococcus phage S-CBM2]|nr:structural protein [Synechococcus phage S-CBM2]